MAGIADVFTARSWCSSQFSLRLILGYIALGSKRLNISHGVAILLCSCGVRGISVISGSMAFLRVFLHRSAGCVKESCEGGSHVPVQLV